MTNILLYIRQRQLMRELNGLGLYILLLLAFTCFLIYMSFKTYHKTPDAYYLIGFLSTVCFWIQSYRKDKPFIYQHVEKPHLAIYAEYIVLTFPFAITSVFTLNWMCYPILLICLFIIPFFKFTLRQKTYFKNISSLISASDFELISGLRRSFVVLIPLYILALSFSWFRIFPLFILWLITASIGSFYNECEPIHILKEGGLSAKKFLIRKLLQHSKYIIVLYAPILIANAVFNIEYQVVDLLFIPVQISLLSFAICFKYANYMPNENSIGNNIIVSLVTFGSAIPYLLPIPLLMALYYYWKAKNNLEYYFND